MGSFRGHALPGTVFLTIATWWTVNITRKYLKTNSAGAGAYRNTVSFPLLICSWQIPIEGIIKIVGSSIDIVGELHAAFDTGVIPRNVTNSSDIGMSEGGHIQLDDIQHATISSFFLLHGIFDILKSKNCLTIPLELDYITLFMAFTVEGMMFYFHILYRTDVLDKTMHQLLLVAISGCVISVALEYKYRNSLLFAFTRAFFAFLQGTWFFQVAFILYPQFSWQNAIQSYTMKNSSHSSMLSATMFAWNIAGIFIIMSVIYLVTNFCSSVRSSTISCFERLQGKNSSSNGAVYGHHVLQQADAGDGQYELLDAQSGDEQDNMLEVVTTKTNY